MLTPSNKANAVLNMVNRKRPRDETPRGVLNLSMNKSVPDSTKKKAIVGKQVNIEVQEVLNIKNTFKVLFKMVEVWKRALRGNHKPVVLNEEIEERQRNEEVIDNPENLPEVQAYEDDKENENVVNEEFDRSDDNVLISNRYSNAGVRTVQRVDNGDKEWVMYIINIPFFKAFLEYRHLMQYSIISKNMYGS